MRRLVLVVENDNDLSEVLVYVLTKSGFNVQKANDGIKGEALALQYLRFNNFRFNTTQC